MVISFYGLGAPFFQCRLRKTVKRGNFGKQKLFVNEVLAARQA